MHSSLAKDAAETADGVGKSLTAAAVVREHGGSGAGALVGLEFRPIPISTASGSGREAASNQREPRMRSPIDPTHPRQSACVMRWPESSRIDPAIAADGKTGRWALARVDSYTIPIDPGHRGARGPGWRRREKRVCYN